MIRTHRSNFSMSDKTHVGEAVPSAHIGGLRPPLGSVGSGLHGGGGGRGLPEVRDCGRESNPCWRCSGFGGTVNSRVARSLVMSSSAFTSISNELFEIFTLRFGSRCW